MPLLLNHERLTLLRAIMHRPQVAGKKEIAKKKKKKALIHYGCVVAARCHAACAGWGLYCTVCRRWNPALLRELTQAEGGLLERT